MASIQRGALQWKLIRVIKFIFTIILKLWNKIDIDYNGEIVRAKLNTNILLICFGRHQNFRRSTCLWEALLPSGDKYSTSQLVNSQKYKYWNDQPKWNEKINNIHILKMKRNLAYRACWLGLHRGQFPERNCHIPKVRTNSWHLDFLCFDNSVIIKWRSDLSPWINYVPKQGGIPHTQSIIACLNIKLRDNHFTSIRLSIWVYHKYVMHE